MTRNVRPMRGERCRKSTNGGEANCKAVRIVKITVGGKFRETCNKVYTYILQQKAIQIF